MGTLKEIAGRASRLREAAFKPGNEERLARGLGVFSIGLGLAEIAAPGQMAKLIGVKEHRTMMRGLGTREIASGIGILAARRPAGAVWSRVAGDAMDLSLLAPALSRDNPNRARTMFAAAAVGGITALDAFAARQLTYSPETGYRAMRANAVVAVNRPPEEAYRFWRNFQNLPRVVNHLESVEQTGERRLHFRARAPQGRRVEWDMEIAEDQPDRLIVLRSAGMYPMRHSTVLRFDRAPGGRGTWVSAEIEYTPLAGGLPVVIAKLFGADPAQRLNRAMRAFKQILETGEITKSDASIFPGMHPAQPPAAPEVGMAAR